MNACFWTGIHERLLNKRVTVPCRSGAETSQPAETVRTAELDNRGILQLQRNIMTEQDTELAELEKTVGSTRVRHCAIAAIAFLLSKAM